VTRDVLLYDADCGFCRWSVDKILRWDRGHTIRTVPLQSPEAEELLGPMDPERKMASWHLVNDDGEVRSGGAAAPPLLKRLPGGLPFAMVAQAFPRTTDRAYRLIARNRGRLGRLIGEKACAVEPNPR
jgi:predicted DCC family thiol-disulfide oxidoreductase YuxK